MIYVSNLVFQSGRDLNAESQTFGVLSDFRAKPPAARASSYSRRAAKNSHFLPVLLQVNITRDIDSLIYQPTR